MDRHRLGQLVTQTLDTQPVTDLHTHCYAPRFGHSADGSGQGLLLWGIDELVTYHYLIAEFFRVAPHHGPGGMTYEKFWAMSKPERADHIWQRLFVERTPISEACRGVLTTLSKLGLNPNEKTLEPYRKFFREFTADRYIDKVMELANVDKITMTNEVFSDHERPLWERDPSVGDDPRFDAVLRIDPMLRDWPAAAKKLESWGYAVNPAFTGPSIDETRRFLNDWLDRMTAKYVAVSLPPSFQYPGPIGENGKDPGEVCLERCVLPVLAERGLPFAMMIGAQRGVNPSLRDAGDMVGRADILSVVNLAAGFPDNKLLVTMLSRENQHELCVAARKFGNLLPFGCWWFLNNPSLIEEITRERIELLGTSFVPQHSDARILDQLIYKWDHSRQIIAKVLTDKYAESLDAGFALTEDHIQRDARLLLRDNYRGFIEPAPVAAKA